MAQAAQVSLAATTYHYATKAEMVADASQRLLASYLEDVRRVTRRQMTGESHHPDLASFITQVLANAAGRNRVRSIAWCEIILDAARSPEGYLISQSWFDGLATAWRELAATMGLPDDPSGVLSAIDVVVGFLFIILSLGISVREVEAVLRDGADPIEAWNLQSMEPPGPDASSARTSKALKTEARILQGAIKLLVDQGAGAVAYRSVAMTSGVTITAPAYYFSSIANLLRAAQRELFRASRLRYRQTIAATKVGAPTVEGLTDLTTATFIREATEYGQSSIALYSVWLEAARNPELRSDISAAVHDQAEAWRRRLQPTRPASGVDGITLQALFIGKLVRIVSTGVQLEHLSAVRDEFRSRISRP